MRKKKVLITSLAILLGLVGYTVSEISDFLTDLESSYMYEQAAADTTEPIPDTTEPIPDATEPAPGTAEPAPGTAEPANETAGVDCSITYPVVRVVDGDTIVVDMDGVKEKIRLIGIDTPESVHPDPDRNVEYGEIASGFTEDQLEGKAVALEFDVQERDKYGRVLAYVYLDGKMFNETLLEQGHAMVSTYPPNIKYVDRFTELQTQAREAKLGLWAEKDPDS